MVAGRTGFDQANNKVRTRHDLAPAAADATRRFLHLERGEPLKVSRGHESGDGFPVPAEDHPLALVGDAINDLGQTIPGFADAEFGHAGYDLFNFVRFVQIVREGGYGCKH